MTSSMLGEIGQWTITEIFPTGYWLTNEDQERLFLPVDNATTSLAEKQVIDVFVTTDNQGQMIADTRLPTSAIGEPIVLTAKDAVARGAFFDWGLTRDLYVPQKWQESPINPGMQYVVVPFVDEKSQRILGCTKLKHFFPESSQWLKPKQAVSLTVFAKTSLGYKVLIDNAALGLLFHSDVHVKLRIGDTLQGSIKLIREDGKIDVSIGPVNAGGRKALHETILEDLEAHDGISTLTDKSSPGDIYDKFNVSKGAYKKALGHLFKNKKIKIDNNVIRLLRK